MTQELFEIDALYRGIIALLERSYSSVRLGAICLISRQPRHKTVLDRRHTSNPGHTLNRRSGWSAYYSQRTGAPCRPGLGSASDGESNASEVSTGEVGDSVSEVMFSEDEDLIRSGVKKS